MNNDDKIALSRNGSLKVLVCLLLSCIFALAACAPKEPSTPGTRSGMHIDAVLEFVVVYPLGWSKDRRIQFGSSSGEVRWTAPGNSDTRLRLFSYIPGPETGTPKETFTNALPEHPKLKITSEEPIKLPAGESIHLTARTGETEIEAYLLTTNERHYMILISTSGNIHDYEAIVNEAIQSFNIVK